MEAASYILQMEVDVPIPKSSVHEYFVQKIEEKMLEVNEKGQNLRRLQAQRNELNAKGMLDQRIAVILFLDVALPRIISSSTLVRMLREELQLLQEQGSYVGEVVKAMGKV